MFGNKCAVVEAVSVAGSAAPEAVKFCGLEWTATTGGGSLEV